MQKHIFNYLAAIIVCLFCVNTNVFAEPIIKRPLVICVMGENKEYNNMVASLVLENDTNATLGNIEIRDFKPMDFLPAKGVDNVRVGVITYDPKIDDFNQIESVFKNKFDCIGVVYHVSDEKTFKYDKIKKFYDIFNEAWIGKDVYNTMVYKPNGEHRLKMWYYMLKEDRYHSPRASFFVYNGKRSELITNKEFINSLDNYVSAMPDSRNIFSVDLNDKDTSIMNRLMSLTYDTTSDFLETRTLQNIQKLDNLEDTKKKNTNGFVWYNPFTWKNKK